MGQIDSFGEYVQDRLEEWGREFALYADHNVLATQRLLEAAVEAGTPRVVYASSSSVYGDSTDMPLREGAVCRPMSPNSRFSWVQATTTSSPLRIACW